MKKPSVKISIIRSVCARKGEVILRSELNKFGSKSQVSRSLSEIVREGGLVRIGYGIYVKTRVNMFSNAKTPRKSLGDLAVEALRKLNVQVTPGKAAMEYASGRTTQVPAKMTLNTGRRKITRIISAGGQKINYENNFTRRG